MSAFEKWLASIFAKAPHLPANGRETLRKIAPWLALIFGVLGVIMVLSALATLPLLMSVPFAGMAMMSGGWFPMMVLALICAGLGAILDLMAYKPLSKRQKKGWNLIFYGSTLSAVYSLLTLILGHGGIGSILGIIIGYWLLFEIRDGYTSVGGGKV